METCRKDLKIIEETLKYNRDNDSLKFDSNIVEVLFFKFYVFLLFIENILGDVKI